MIIDLNNAYNHKPENIEKLFIIYRSWLTKNKNCSVCDNAEVKEKCGTVHTYCNVHKEYRDYCKGSDCPDWKEKYSDYNYTEEGD